MSSQLILKSDEYFFKLKGVRASSQTLGQFRVFVMTWAADR